MYKILHITHLLNRGGAARATHRIHSALLSKGVDSKIFTFFNDNTDKRIYNDTNITDKVINRIIHRINLKVLNPLKKDSRRIFTFPLLRSKRFKYYVKKFDPDIIHLHWVAGGVVDFELLKTLNKPVVWTIHDDNPFTGGCHVKWSCLGFKTDCSNCPVIKYNLAYRAFKSKHNWYKNLNLTVIAVSSGLEKNISESKLLSRFNRYTIGNPVNPEEFKILDKAICRKKYKIALNEKVLLFGAMNADEDYNKGLEIFVNSLNYLHSENHNLTILIFGVNKTIKAISNKYKTHVIGQVKNNLILSELYSAADVFINPSLQESFGQTATESMCCGTPVVGFKGSGLDDIINDDNGVLIQIKEGAELGRGILNVLNREFQSKKIRKSILKKFSSELIAEKYTSVYENIIG